MEVPIGSVRRKFLQLWVFRKGPPGSTGRAKLRNPSGPANIVGSMEGKVVVRQNGMPKFIDRQKGSAAPSSTATFREHSQTIRIGIGQSLLQEEALRRVTILRNKSGFFVLSGLQLLSRFQLALGIFRSSHVPIRLA